MNAAHFAKNFGTWAKKQMVGIGEQNLGTDFEQSFGAMGFDRRLSAHGHEDRRGHFAMQCFESGRAGARGLGGGGFDGERKSIRVLAHELAGLIITSL